MVDIYSNKSKFKAAILAVAMMVAIGSIYYTQDLVKKLEQREKKLIDLYAKGLQQAVSPNSNTDLTFLFREILDSNNTIPIILTDEKGTPLSFLNIDIPPDASENETRKILLKEIEWMKSAYPPIVIDYSELGIKNYIYYRNSKFLTRLRYYPFVQLSIIAALGIIAYIAFSYSRNAEQNRLWVGLAKETAHQLGTPLSSLMAWHEILKQSNTDPAIVSELEKDIVRLSQITERFSSIGSTPSYSREHAEDAISEVINYLSKRISAQVTFDVINHIGSEDVININKPLFAWVIENICKNAVDAMDGAGHITIEISKTDSHVAIDIADTGKGIPKSKFKEVFKPGYTTKKRGWGLGLTLVKRIIEHYHKGKIFILHSELNKGTTFRILL
ncbi:MAG: HAMP domain-containing histidine kinase [Cytophagaceae bacterium]|nr:HAMP domain-containing histidine kinase [Cytophagaceae bacterium]MDW8456554.1 HAMP domain-containing sensor histidine kinase [Cytophagaceae bacterium]